MPAPPRYVPTECADSPSRRDLRARLFWIARWLFGGDEYHHGSLQVVIGEGAPHGGDKLVIRPKPGEEVYDAEDGPAGTDHMVAIAPKLLTAFLSADALAVMRYIAEKGGVAAKVIPSGARVERSKCYVLITDLRDRGLIRDAGNGYVISNVELWGAVDRRS